MIPVIVSVRSWSWVFLSNRTRAVTPSQFLMAILLSWSRPYEMFFSAPQAEWCTSLLGWSSSDTKAGIPFRRRTSDLTYTQKRIKLTSRIFQNKNTVILHFNGIFAPPYRFWMWDAGGKRRRWSWRGPDGSSTWRWPLAAPAVSMNQEEPSSACCPVTPCCPAPSSWERPRHTGRLLLRHRPECPHSSCMSQRDKH